MYTSQMNLDKEKTQTYAITELTFFSTRACASCGGNV